MRLLPGMVLFMVIVLFWYVPAIVAGGESYLKETLLNQTIDRFARGTSHIEPFYYYFLNFPADFLPWFLFLPGAVILALSQKEEKISETVLFSLVWFASIFLFFSLSKGKRPIYLLPLYPAASLLVGRLWDAYLSGEQRYSIRKIWVSLPISFLAVSFFIAGIVLLLVPVVANLTVHPSTPKVLSTVIKRAGIGNAYLSSIPHEIYLLILTFFLGMGLLLSFAHRFEYKAATFALVVAVVGIGFFYGTRVIFPLVNPYKSARYISEEIKQTIKPGERLAMYGDFGSAGTAPYNFYTGIVPILAIERENEVIDFLRSRERVLCILRYQDYEKLSAEDTGVPLRLLARRGVGHNDMALVSNVPFTADSSSNGSDARSAGSKMKRSGLGVLRGLRNAVDRGIHSLRRLL